MCPRPARGPAARGASRAAAARRPPSDARAYLPAGVPDQGPRPLCLPFAFTGAHDALVAATGAPVATHAPEALWWRCTSLGLTRPDGTLLSAVGDALADVGQPRLSDWPFDPALGSGTQDPPTSCGPAPWETANWRHVDLARDGIEDELEDWLAAGYPVVLVLELTRSFLSPDVEGFVSTPPVHVEPGDYHAVLAVGAATHPARGRHLLIRNSWGAAWAVGGYCWLGPAYLAAFGPQAAVLAP